jgi:hypothetical protein
MKLPYILPQNITIKKLKAIVVVVMIMIIIIITCTA